MRVPPVWPLSMFGEAVAVFTLSHFSLHTLCHFCLRNTNSLYLTFEYDHHANLNSWSTSCCPENRSVCFKELHNHTTQQSCTRWTKICRWLYKLFIWSPAVWPQQMDSTPRLRGRRSSVMFNRSPLGSLYCCCEWVTSLTITKDAGEKPETPSCSSVRTWLQSFFTTEHAHKKETIKQH